MSLFSDTQKQLLVPVAFVFLALLLSGDGEGAPFAIIAVFLNRRGEGGVMATMKTMSYHKSHNWREWQMEEGKWRVTQALGRCRSFGELSGCFCVDWPASARAGSPCYWPIALPFYFWQGFRRLSIAHTALICSICHQPKRARYEQGVHSGWPCFRGE